MADTKIGSQSRPAAIRVFEAIYEHGVLKPLEDPGLTENHRFSVQVQELGEPEAQPRKRTFGSAKGLIKIADDFDDPLEDFREYM